MPQDIYDNNISWRMEFATETTAQENRYIASYDGTTYTNCMRADNKLVVFFQNHNLGCGDLYFQIYLRTKNELFPSGLQRIVLVDNTKIMIWEGNSDDIALPMEITPLLMPFLQGRGVTKMTLDTNSDIIVSYSDGTEENIGSILKNVIYFESLTTEGIQQAVERYDLRQYDGLNLGLPCLYKVKADEPAYTIGTLMITTSGHAYISTIKNLTQYRYLLDLDGNTYTTATLKLTYAEQAAYKTALAQDSTFTETLFANKQFVTWNNSINTANTAAKTAQTTADEAKEAVDNLEFGSRNLIIGSESFMVPSNGAAAVSSFDYRIFMLPITVSTGDVFTIRIDEITNKIGDATGYTYSLRDAYSGIAYSKEIGIAGKEYQLVVTAADVHDVSACLFIYAGEDGSTRGNLVQFDRAMLVKGNKMPSTWAAAPEDVQVDLDNRLAGMVSTDAQTLTAAQQLQARKNIDAEETIPVFDLSTVEGCVAAYNAIAASERLSCRVLVDNKVSSIGLGAKSLTTSSTVNIVVIDPEVVTTGMESSSETPALLTTVIQITSTGETKTLSGGIYDSNAMFESFYENLEVFFEIILSMVPRNDEQQNFTSAERSMLFANLGVNVVFLDSSQIGTTLDDATAAAIEQAQMLVVAGINNQTHVFSRGKTVSTTTSFYTVYTSSVIYRVNYNATTKQLSASEVKIEDSNAVSFAVLQLLTSEQKTIARNNISAMAATPSGDPMHYMFELLGATWNATTRYWELDYLTDITTDQMREIYLWHNPSCVPTTNGRYGVPTTVRAVVNMNSSGAQGTCAYMFSNCRGAELITFNGVGIAPSNLSMQYMFNACSKLEVIAGRIDLRLITNASYYTYMFNGCTSLREVRLYRLTTGGIDLSHTAVLSAASVRYMVENAENTEAISIFVAPEVAGNISSNTGDWEGIYAAAAEKQITFVNVSIPMENGD